MLFLHKCFIQSGGIERVHQNLANALKTSNVDSVFYVMNASGESEKGYEALQKSFDAHCCRDGQGIFQNIKDIKKLVSQKDISVIIAATEKANLVAFLCKLSLPSLKVVYTRHCAFDVSDQRLPPFAIKALYSLFALNGRVVAVSDSLATQIKNSVLLHRDRVHFIPNAVVSDEMLDKANDSSYVQPDYPYFIAVGRLVEQKGFDILLPAYAKAIAKDQSLPKLMILGEGNDRDSLQAQANTLQIADRVTFAGFTNNPYAPIKHACAFILSSRHEGMPTVLIESLALGTPVIAFDCPTGPSEIIEQGRNGFLVDHLNEQALAEAILSYKSLPTQDLEAGVKDFAFKSVANQYLQVSGYYNNE